jgi:hypothetical protein
VEYCPEAGANALANANLKEISNWSEVPPLSTPKST